MGYFAGGLSVFFFWNVTTVLGAVALKSNGDLVTKFGLDATVPAAFAALLWPRLRDPENRKVALVGALIALVLIPIAPAGIPIVASGFAVLVIFVKAGRGVGDRVGGRVGSADEMISAQSELADDLSDRAKNTGSAS
jgi:predicted branched-subunit amino acid permease